MLRSHLLILLLLTHRIASSEVIPSFLDDYIGSDNKIYSETTSQEGTPDPSANQGTKRYPFHLDPIIMKMGPKFWIRSGECPITPDGGREYFCPSPTSSGQWVCIDDYHLCDGVMNCPNAEDESATQCLFYRAIRAQIALLAQGMESIEAAEN